MTVNSITEPATGSDVLARTQALIPELRARADEATALRRLPDESVRMVKDAGSLKVIQATRNGGLGLSIRDHLSVIAALGEGCGSTAWVAGVVHAHSWLLSHFPVEAQDDVYGPDANTLVSAVIGPRGRATRVDGGWRVSGVWPFASGNEASDWLLLGVFVVDEDGSEIDQGDIAIPTSEATRHDDWFVAGLAGTGSCTVSVENAFVPEHRYLSLPGLIIGNSPGAGAHEGWLHRCAPVPVLSIALTGSAIGIARRALADFPPLIKGKTIAYTADDEYSHPMTHARAADAAMLIHEGELILFNAADQIDEAARSGNELPFETKARIRLDCAQGVRRCLEGVEILFKLSGASGVRLSSPLTRAVADLRAINQHGLLNLEMNQELYGRVLLGLEPNTPLI
jgi:3-hydroxy-9,10-secoandrosta-1,3,5(10)-triene-9,17-dione monooxygenase